MITCFAELLSPYSEKTFFEDVFGESPLHISGEPDKFSSVLSWEKFNALLNMAGIWSGTTLKLFKNGDGLPPASYCHPAQDRLGQPILQPVSSQVQAHLKQGYSLIANDVGTLNAGLDAVARHLEKACQGKIQANIYCSWEHHQAFQSHCDVHDVFVLHIEGEKTWRVYEGREDSPIAHPTFQNTPQEKIDKQKGAIALEITLKAGDLLYIPRGVYHDALAQTPGSLHVSFGLTRPIGLDLLALLYEASISESFMRRPLPHLKEGTDLNAYTEAFCKEVSKLCQTQAFQKQATAMVQKFAYPHNDFHLGEDTQSADALSFKLKTPNLKVVKDSDAFYLTDGKEGAPIPKGAEKLVSWIIGQTAFTAHEIKNKFSGINDPDREAILQALSSMNVIEAA